MWYKLFEFVKIPKFVLKTYSLVKLLFSVFCFLFFQTGSHYVAQPGPELTTLSLLRADIIGLCPWVHSL